MDGNGTKPAGYFTRCAAAAAPPFCLRTTTTPVLVHTQEFETSIIDVAGNLSVPGCSETDDIAKYLGMSTKEVHDARAHKNVRVHADPLPPCALPPCELTVDAPDDRARHDGCGAMPRGAGQVSRRAERDVRHELGHAARARAVCVGVEALLPLGFRQSIVAPD